MQESMYMECLMRSGKINFKNDRKKNNSLYNFFLNSSGNKMDKWHHYFDIYEENFKKYKGKDITLLEIGVFKGASLKMWKEYFGKKTKIYGIDIDPECKKYEKDNIKIFCRDQSNPEFLKKSNI